MLDGIVVSVALPEIGDDVGLRGAELQWVITAYTLPLGAFLLVARTAGRARRRLDARRVRRRVLLLALFAATQLRGRRPLLPLRLVGSTRVTGANLAIVANAGAFGGTVVLSSLFMQRVLGLTALETGLALVPLALSALGGGFLAPRLIDRLGTARTVALSLVATAACLGWTAGLAGSGSGYWGALFPAYCVAGCTFATAAVPLTAAVIGEARARERGLAAGLFHTFTHVGGALVLAILVVAAAARAAAAGERAGVEAGFALAALILLIGAAVALRLLCDPHLHLRRMSVLEQVQSDVKDAMKAGERERVHALRLIVSELQKAAKDDGGDEIQVLQRERKRRLEAAEAYRDGGRTAAAAAEEREAEIIASYLPAQLSDEELEAIVGDAVAESGASSPSEMGKVMGLIMPKVQGRADGKRVSAAVREKLTA